MRLLQRDWLDDVRPDTKVTLSQEMLDATARELQTAREYAAETGRLKDVSIGVQAMNLPSAMPEADYYGCVQCQRVHWRGEPLFDAHVYRQDKHGIKRMVKPVAALHGSEAGPQGAREELPPSLQASIDLFREDPALWHAEWQRKHEFKAGLIEKVRQLEAGSGAGVSVRVLELALQKARENHENHSDHNEGPFSHCLNPDCVLMRTGDGSKSRAALGVSPAAEEPGR